MNLRFLASTAALASAALLSLAAAASATTHYCNPSGNCGGNLPCYPNLAAALAAAANGDVIVMQPGLYPIAARVDITREVKIFGPQAFSVTLPSQGSTRVPGDPLTEAILDGGGAISTVLRVLASNVELSGLEIRNGTGDLVDSPAGTPLSNVVVRNNIVHGSSGDEGVQLRTIAGALIECNHVYGTAGDGINLCCGSTDGVIRWNEVHNVSSLDAAMYVYNSTTTRIEGNLIYNSANNEGIKLGAKNGSDAAAAGGLVLHNRIHDTRQDGIAVYISQTEVRCNEVWNSASENGGIYLAWGISNLLVSENWVHDNTFNIAKWGDPAGVMVGTAVNAATVVVTTNRIERNLPNGVTNKAVAMLDARANWWGDPSGPGPVGPGLGDRVSVNVDYSAWLPAPQGPSCPPAELCSSDPTPSRPRSWGALKLRYR